MSKLPFVAFQARPVSAFHHTRKSRHPIASNAIGRGYSPFENAKPQIFAAAFSLRNSIRAP
jgi:hypothetical protein